MQLYTSSWRDALIDRALHMCKDADLVVLLGFPRVKCMEAPRLPRVVAMVAYAAGEGDKAGGVSVFEPQ